jgi:membrane associated rhomboid family serine protease
LCIAIGRSCTVVVGLSAGIYGLLGLFIVDIVIHFRALRALALMLLVVFEIAGIFTAPNGASALAHGSGFALGLLPSLCVAQHLGSEVADAVVPLVGVVCCVTLTIALPIVAFHRVLPSLVCGG